MAGKTFFREQAASQDRRRSPRFLCSHLVEVGSGSDALRGLLEDLSREGAAVAVESPIPAGAEVEVAAPGLWMPALVRYCLKRESDFRLGLEFRDGFRWDRTCWEPDHLYLPSSRPD